MIITFYMAIYNIHIYIRVDKIYSGYAIFNIYTKSKTIKKVK